MKTTENNKLIAEFMGLLPESEKNKIIWYDPDRTTFGTGCMHSKDLKYHSSWNWLMPVLDKIESIDRGDEKGLFLLVFNRNSVCWNNIPPSVTGISKKHATYKAAIKFIKWYNKTILK